MSAGADFFGRNWYFCRLQTGLIKAKLVIFGFGLLPGGVEHDATRISYIFTMAGSFRGSKGVRIVAEFELFAPG